MCSSPESHLDAVLTQLVAEAAADPAVLGLVLLGSRSVGDSTAESDYDLSFIVTDAAMELYQQAAHLPPRGRRLDPPIETTDLRTAALSALSVAHLAAWQRPAWADAQVLYDRTGEITTAVDALR